MGGFGSGRRPSYDKRRTVEEGLKLSTKYVSDALNDVLENGHGSRWDGVLTWGRGEKITASMRYQAQNVDGLPRIYLSFFTTYAGGQILDNSHYLEVTRTFPYYGGQRWWWLCPLGRRGVPCNRRAALLYLPYGAHYFGCRQCHNLTYRSCQESHRSDRLEAMLAKYRKLKTCALES